MFNKNKDTENELLKAEVLRLRKEVINLNKQLTIANQFQEEYKKLCADTKAKQKILEQLIKETKELGKEKQNALNKI